MITIPSILTCLASHQTYSPGSDRGSNLSHVSSVSNLVIKPTLKVMVGGARGLWFIGPECLNEGDRVDVLSALFQGFILFCFLKKNPLTTSSLWIASANVIHSPFFFFLNLQVPKEKRLLPVPKLAEITEEQEKRSVNSGGSVHYLRLHMHRQKDAEKNVKYVAASRPFPAMHKSPVAQ